MAQSVELCNNCNNAVVIDTFPRRCECGDVVLPCSSCIYCTINPTFDICARYGVSLKSEKDDLERVSSKEALAAAILGIAEKVITERRVYEEFYRSAMMANLSLLGLELDDLRIFYNPSKCASNHVASSIRICMEKLWVTYTLDFEMSVYIAFWEVYMRKKSGVSLVKYLEDFGDDHN